MSIDGGASGFPRLDDVAGWLEALGLRAWIPGCSLAPPNAEACARALPGVTTPAVRHVFSLPTSSTTGSSELTGRELAAQEPAARERAVGQLAATARRAAEARAPWVIVDLGRAVPLPPVTAPRERERGEHVLLDRLCRALHEASRSEPQAGFALATPSEPDHWLTPAVLGHVFEELGSRRRLAYWHDAGRAHALEARGEGPAARWLDLHAKRCVGIDATDAVGAEASLPAGAGEVDFPALLGAVAAATWVSLRSELATGPGPLLAAVRHLRAVRS